MPDALDRPLAVGPSAHLGPALFALPQPEAGVLDLVRALERRVQILEEWQRALIDQQACRWTVRLRWRWARLIAWIGGT
jgi:hypothetical protein